MTEQELQELYDRKNQIWNSYLQENFNIYSQIISKLYPLLKSEDEANVNSGLNILGSLDSDEDSLCMIFVLENGHCEIRSSFTDLDISIFERYLLENVTNETSAWYPLFQYGAFDRMLLRAYQNEKWENLTEEIKRYLLLLTKRTVDIPSGSFFMGAQTHDVQHFQNEFPLHKVHITIPFSMGVFPVTQCLWSSIMEKNPSAHVMITAPVERVSWCDAILFCNRLSTEQGLEPVYSMPAGFVDILKNQKPNISSNSKVDKIAKEISWNRYANGYRLPTEAEWEYAAKGTHFDTFPGGNNYKEIAWCKENSAGRLQPIGQKKSNFRDIYGLSGNVNEWCFDAVNPKYFTDLYSNRKSNETKDPVFFDSSVVEKVRRGGSWKLNTKNIRVSYRGKNVASAKKNDLGFRLVRTLKS